MAGALGERRDGREDAARRDVGAQAAEQHLVGRARVFGVILEAVALEVLHGVAALGELFGQRVAEDRAGRRARASIRRKPPPRLWLRLREIDRARAVRRRRIDAPSSATAIR